MGVEPYLLASTLTLVVAQRLVRRICTTCRESISIEESVPGAVLERQEFTDALPSLRQRGLISGGDGSLKSIRLFRGHGCPRCGGTGYSGRIGLFELFEITPEVRQIISGDTGVAAFRAAAMRNGMRTMFEDGLEKALLGETTIDELLRATA
jgi:type II secretory ATPase GspE/PulE/Tfp pilus assembly ATPase PilB-like protein